MIGAELFVLELWENQWLVTVADAVGAGVMAALIALLCLAPGSGARERGIAALLTVLWGVFVFL